MNINALHSAIESLGGTVRVFLFDGGETLMVNVRGSNGRAVLIRYTDYWGDDPSNVQRAVATLREHGIFVGEEDPTAEHEGAYL